MLAYNMLHQHTPGLCCGSRLGAPQLSDLHGCLLWPHKPVSILGQHHPCKQSRQSTGRGQYRVGSRKQGFLEGPLELLLGWEEEPGSLSLSPSLRATSLSLSSSICGLGTVHTHLPGL